MKESRDPRTRRINGVAHYNSWEKVQLLKQLLCIRSPSPSLSAEILSKIDDILLQSRNQRVLTRGQSIPSVAILKRIESPNIHIKIWQGDITSLASDVTAITNAANGQMLGCFQPTHKCIDNVIHSMAGPRLRNECFEIMNVRGSELPIGEAILTKGYCLPSPFVIHTVGPQLAQGATPTNDEIQELRQCYVSILEQAEGLPNNQDGTKIIALCGISTGLFAFPTKTATRVAVDTVTAWLVHHEDTSITGIVFVTFAEGDFEIYKNVFQTISEPYHQISAPISPVFEIEGQTLESAREMLVSADNVIVSVGAGLSAAEGLDYTSKTLFKREFPAFLRLGLKTLYSAIGFNKWPSEEDKWAYYFHNVKMVRSWPSWPLYEKLITWLKTSGKNIHVRTSNADGLFLANGWPEAKLSTPQGRYSVLQCLSKCRPDSTFETISYYEVALPFIDSQAQKLTDPSKVPRCSNCGGEMMLCVRGGSWFNDTPFQSGEANWKQFRQWILQGSKRTVILELGVGMNTPGVLRWPNEDLVRRGGGRITLVRVGLGPSISIPEDLEEEGLAICVDSDIKLALLSLLPDVGGEA
ncbi:hypothetical protein GQ44DRAFT_684485 [Phaeosphaeriaceae sp. PMI808]|nr:hypothetical protein GQ44DRAFT_684485 [Phaeosphaeriaceae sp. PMI808]